MEPTAATNLAILPSVDEILKEPTGMRLCDELGREVVVRLVREIIGAFREELHDNISTKAGNRESIRNAIVERLALVAWRDQRSGVRRVINATGVIVHTNLGRAPLSQEAVKAMVAAAGYSSIEFDIQAGERGPRGQRAVSMLRRVTGAEDALIVNNCAAAAMLVLSVFASGREVLVSRGELVEIGGDFRIPDVLLRSGAILKEVGTTNRTHLRDYENAISDQTAMVLKVHPSNYRITGFTTVPSTSEIASLARKHEIVFYEDAGSGAIIGTAKMRDLGEPVIRDVIAQGADLVSFSCDKLLGGPQAGVVVGRAELVSRLRRDPMYRALRLDKVLTAALEATLLSYQNGTAADTIPVLRMLGENTDGIRRRSDALVSRLRHGSELKVILAESDSALGGGSAPNVPIKTVVIALRHSRLSEAEFAARLRLNDQPIIARIEGGQVLIDLRTVEPDEEAAIIEALNKLASPADAEDTAAA